MDKEWFACQIRQQPGVVAGQVGVCEVDVAAIQRLGHSLGKRRGVVPVHAVQRAANELGMARQCIHKSADTDCVQR
jgi:hypothetical protein